VAACRGSVFGFPGPAPHPPLLRSILIFRNPTQFQLPPDILGVLLITLSRIMTLESHGIQTQRVTDSWRTQVPAKSPHPLPLERRGGALTSGGVGSGGCTWPGVFWVRRQRVPAPGPGPSQILGQLLPGGSGCDGEGVVGPGTTGAEARGPAGFWLQEGNIPSLGHAIVDHGSHRHCRQSRGEAGQGMARQVWVF
jgi:hypothetical protein